MSVLGRLPMLVLAVLVTGCGTSPVPLPNLDGTTQDAEFGLRIHASQAVFRTVDPVVVDATLSYLGPALAADIFGDAGVLGFGLRQLDGRLHMFPANDLMCAKNRIDRLTPFHGPFAKSGGFTGDDPDAPFWRAYFADPVLHLPPGTWQISAIADFTTRDACGPPSHTLTATVTVQVIP